MSSLWELSTDTVVTAVIVVGISMLVIAWLLAGPRRPAQTSVLEERRRAGREAEDLETSATPPNSAAAAKPDAIPTAKPQMQAPSEEVQTLKLAETPKLSPTSQTSAAVETPKTPPLILQQPKKTAEQAPKPKPATPPPPAPQSAEKARAMSIAAALVRHDKRGGATAEHDTPEVTPVPISGSGGDDLTAISGIDQELAKELNDLGIRYFDQIVSWAPDHAAWIFTQLSTPVTREQRIAWIAEAKALSSQSAQDGRSHAGQGR